MNKKNLLSVVLFVLTMVAAVLILSYQPEWKPSQKVLDGVAVSMAEGEAMEIVNYLRTSDLQSDKALTSDDLHSLKFPETIDPNYFESVLGATLENNVWHLSLVARDSSHTIISVSEMSKVYIRRYVSKQ